MKAGFVTVKQRKTSGPFDVSEYWLNDEVEIPDTEAMIRKALQRDGALAKGQMYFAPDMEETKTWLVTD